MNIGDLTFTQQLSAEHQAVATPQACAFVADLVARFADLRDELLATRRERVSACDAGQLPDFLPETADIRDGDWQVRAVPDALLDRRIEITGPVDRKMVINALNADVNVFMADFEDSLSPTWNNIINGQINLRDACDRSISYVAPNGKSYALGDTPATLFCRVRGLHLDEKHILMNGRAIPGCLLDFGFYLWHNHRALRARGSAPYFYIPKLESHLEARWWNAVINHAQAALGLAAGTTRVTVLIETFPAVFEMNEILWELRDHIVALNCGRWDYIFSFIKTLKNHRQYVVPDRAQVGMDAPFLSAYSRLLIHTCHKRGALAMGGMSAFIPQKDEAVNAQAMEKVRQDKELEASRGHDGGWIAHPGLADVARAAFDRAIGAGKNQMHRKNPDDAAIGRDELYQLPDRQPSEAGVRANIRIALHYIAAWLCGNGCSPIYNLMEDAATAEISRSSIWQIVRHGAALADGQTLDADGFRAWVAAEAATVESEMAGTPFLAQLAPARAMLVDMCLGEFVDFLTLPAYEKL